MPNPSPNALPSPLAQARGRMDRVSLDVLREADRLDRAGEDVGVWKDVLLRFAPLLPFVREAA